MRAIFETGTNLSLIQCKKMTGECNRYLDLNRRPSLRAAAFGVVEIWSFQERSDLRVTPSIEILSLNSSELESNDMSGRFLTTRLEIRQH